MNKFIILAGVAVAALVVAAPASAETCTQIGNQVFCGSTTYTTIGNQTFGSDGSSSMTIGNQTFINPAPAPVNPYAPYHY